MGSNEYGKLGLDLTYKEFPYSKSPRLVESIDKIKVIATGLHHTLAVGKDNKVYGWGCADNGAIGMRLSHAPLPY